MLSRRLSAKCVLATLACVAGLLAQSAPPAARAYFAPEFKTGFVVARNVVLGPNGAPIFAEFDAEGEVVEVIGEAIGEMEGAWVMSAAAYLTHLANYDAFIADFGNTKAKGARLLTREEYQGEDFGSVTLANPTDPDAPPVSVPINKPALDPATRSVLVRHPQTIVSEQIAAEELVLFESRIDLRNRVDLAGGTASVLLDRATSRSRPRATTA